MEAKARTTARVSLPRRILERLRYGKLDLSRVGPTSGVRVLDRIQVDREAIGVLECRRAVPSPWCFPTTTRRPESARTIQPRLEVSSVNRATSWSLPGWTFALDGRVIGVRVARQEDGRCCSRRSTSNVLASGTTSSAARGCSRSECVTANGGTSGTASAGRFASRSPVSASRLIPRSPDRGVPRSARRLGRKPRTPAGSAECAFFEYSGRGPPPWLQKPTAYRAL